MAKLDQTSHMGQLEYNAHGSADALATGTSPAQIGIEWTRLIQTRIKKVACATDYGESNFPECQELYRSFVEKHQQVLAVDMVEEQVHYPRPLNTLEPSRGEARERAIAHWFIRRELAYQPLWSNLNESLLRYQSEEVDSQYFVQVMDKDDGMNGNHGGNGRDEDENDDENDDEDDEDDITWVDLKAISIDCNAADDRPEILAIAQNAASEMSEPDLGGDDWLLEFLRHGPDPINENENVVSSSEWEEGLQAKAPCLSRKYKKGL